MKNRIAIQYMMLVVVRRIMADNGLLLLYS